jgi:hypothetical protein
MASMRVEQRAALVAAVLGTCVAALPAAAAVDFSPRITVKPGPGITDVAVGDVNGDALLDVVALRPEAGIVPAPFTAGTFVPGAPIPVGAAAQTLALADVNRDGRLDAVATSFGTNSVRVMLGNGLGGFVASATIPVGRDPYEVASGDLNADGLPDFAVVNNRDATVTVLLGRGDGTFGVSTVAVGGNPTAVAIGDLTRDGKADIVTTSATARPGVVVLVGLGDGTFGATSLRSRTPQPGVGLAIGDLTRDGVPDVAVSSDRANTVTIMNGAGNGLFATGVVLDASTSPFGVVIADLNADGLPEVAVSNSGSNDATVFEALPNGFARGKQFVTGTAPLYLRAADVTRDGRTDLVVGNNGGSLTILPSRDLPVGTTGTAKGVLGCKRPRRIVVGDSVACVRPGMSRAQVREILGKPTERRKDGGLVTQGYRSRFVVFDGNVAGSVGTITPRDRTALGVGVGTSERTVRRRYPAAICSGSRATRSCDIAVNGITTSFVIDRGRVSGILVGRK